MKNKIINFLNQFDIKPNNLLLFKQVFTHKTFSNENKKFLHYDRLEFLGDALIQFKISLLIYKTFPKITEGEATIKRSKIVNTSSLAKIAFNLKLNQYLQISKGALEILDNPKVNADLFEALSAAIYLDQGEKKLDEFFEKTIYNLVIDSHQILKDPKSQFQEYIQASTKQNATYKVVWNNEVFEAKLLFDDQIYGIGKGKSKKEAETNAAINALERLKKNEIN
ncbi:ribonuclease III [Mesomycoplasma neurolyticum]|uniref:Ribonuclease 3 n=1 Tax=Mesomycoplasma neurolyticum TaxID=2120 RepID=A0A449A4Q7_9BACT|nr:ribonuclease III [Mesomycoplasma neurolyticum]VEU59270.1 ribonuclease III (RNase III) [Mesomycoplasma neurolyticum]